MQGALRAAVIALTMCLADVQAGPARTAVKGVPTIDGREVPRFILLEPLRTNRTAAGLSNRDMMDRLVGQLLPGQFVPVSEDAKGVYYQAARGFQREGHTRSVPAGLYVSKTRARTMFAYAGDARHLTAAIELDAQPLTTAQMAKLKIGAVAGKPPK